jgi:polar amino acid transport system permease protein
MNRRAWTASVALSAAALVLLLAVAAPAAFAAGSASPSPAASTITATTPQGTPIIVGVVPDPKASGEAWTGDRVSVNLVLNGSEIDVAKCQVFINGKLQELSSPPSLIYLAPANPTLQFLLKTTLPNAQYSFKAEVVTTKGITVEKTWGFESKGAASGGSLINVTVMREWFWYIAGGAVITVELTIVSILLASIFALFGALGRLSKKMTFRQAWDRYQSHEYMFRMIIGRIPYWAATFYTSLFRGTPLLLQIYVIYVGAPEVLKALGLSGHVPPLFFQHYLGYGTNWNPPAFIAGVAALSLNYGAYLTEVFRAGIQAVPKGQNEAAWAIGLSPWQTQRRVVLPQAFKIVIPAIGNDFIALIKDTSLVSVITVEELLRRAQLAGARSMNFFSTLLVAAAYYWALTIFFSFWQAKLENRMARDKAREREKGRKGA